MKKTYKSDVDCANCANKMETAAKATAGDKSCTVNFMALEMIVEFEKVPSEGHHAECPGQLQKSRGRLRDFPVIG